MKWLAELERPQMRNLVYYIALSIDGKIAGPDHEIEFYPGGPEYQNWMISRFPDTIPTHFREAVGLADVPAQRFDTVLLGGNTYQIGLKTGPASPYSHLRQYVFSRSLEQLDPRVEMVATDPVAKVRELKAEDGDKDIYLCGGGGLAGLLLDEIDQLIIKYYPVVAGAGIDGFGDTFKPTEFDRTDITTFDSGNVVLYYDKRK